MIEAARKRAQGEYAPERKEGGMTKKHFKKIAEVLRQARINGAPEGVWRGLVADVANLFEEENPRFDREKFYIAAGVE